MLEHRNDLLIYPTFCIIQLLSYVLDLELWEQSVHLIAVKKKKKVNDWLECGTKKSQNSAFGLKSNSRDLEQLLENSVKNTREHQYTFPAPHHPGEKKPP